MSASGCALLQFERGAAAPHVGSHHHVVAIEIEDLRAVGAGGRAATCFGSSSAMATVMIAIART